MTTVTGPFESRGTLDAVSQTFVVQNEMLYDYYRIKFGERRGDFIQIVGLPSSIMEGFVAYKGRLYRLTIRDFIKGQLNVAQQPVRINKPTDEPSSGTTTSTRPEPAPAVESTANSDGQPGLGLDIGIQEREAADLAWKEQIDSLLYADDPQEEWVYTPAP